MTEVKKVADAAAINDDHVDLNLDELEREKVYTTFAAVIGGRRVAMTDPANLDWQELLEIDNPTGFLRYCVSDVDRQHFRDQHIPGWKLGKLIERFQTHYGIDPKANAG